MRSDTGRPLPELLAPAGSPEALEAALAAGADAVYLGGSAFNARMNAHNFAPDELIAGVRYAHERGGRVYLTLNTLVYDRELPDALRAAYEAASAGVDGLIIADLGAAACIHRALPELPLHASTQLSGHNAAIGRALARHGFSRFVIARETRLCDLETAVREGRLEVEVFVHGALCVCHSGQCLFSSMVGGRSGNRGECAQPCRLPYRGARGREAYPLSLKDLSLAAHIPALIRAGVSSLKIEGRMKSPAYVGGVVGVFRRLLDERRAATEEEQTFLAELFSRGGFTDEYFTGHIDHRMAGIRSEKDKATTAEAERQVSAGLNPARMPGRIPVTADLTLRPGEPTALTLTAPLWRQEGGPVVSVTVGGPIADAADAPDGANPAQINATVERQLSRTGGTPYVLPPGGCRVTAEGRATLPLSRLNALRREGFVALTEARLAGMPDPLANSLPRGELASVVAAVAEGGSPDEHPAPSRPIMTGSFTRADQITPATAGFFDVCFLPPEAYRELGSAAPGAVIGLTLPPVLFDHEAGAVCEALTEALRGGVRALQVGNVGHWALVRTALKAAGLDDDPSVRLFGDLRLNITDRASLLMQTALCREETGREPEALLLSPELTLPRLRDLCRDGRAAAVVYGRIPLMLLEKCVIRELYPGSADPALPDGRAGAACAACRRGEARLIDRTGAAFPILRTAGHRNVVYNSQVLSMTDRAEQLDRNGILRRHFLFTVETPAEVDRVLTAARMGQPCGEKVRRIK